MEGRREGGKVKGKRGRLGGSATRKEPTYGGRVRAIHKGARVTGKQLLDIYRDVELKRLSVNTNGVFWAVGLSEDALVDLKTMSGYCTNKQQQGGVRLGRRETA